MEQKNKYAQVIVDVPDLDTRTFGYLIPDEILERIKPGIPVIVPFGNRGVVNAFVAGFSNYLPEGINARYIYEILDDEPILNIEYLQLLEWVANYYCCDLQTVIEAAIPGSLFAKTKRVVQFLSDKNIQNHTKNEQKILNFLAQNQGPIRVNSLQKKVKIPYKPLYISVRKLQKNGNISVKNIIEEKKSKPRLEKFIKTGNDSNDLTPRRKAIVEALKATGGEAKLSEFIKTNNTTPATVKSLAGKGVVEVFEREVFRNPANIFKNTEQHDFLELTARQKQALKAITGHMENKNPEPLLLYGVTGSGKTEVYLHAVREAMNRGKSVIMLAPEIILASQLAMRFSARFGAKNVAIWHSSISEGERHDVWKRLRTGEIKIIIGARSAIFAPIKDLGLIIIDEEHESGYKQTSPAPRYNAKTIAHERAKREGAAVVFGSATPDTVTFFRAKNTKSVLSLPERIGKKGLAPVNIVDMREETREGNKSIFSRALKNALLKVFNDKKQAILLMNRRGFSTYGQCPACGFTPKCKKCDIPLILHKTTDKLRCHYCSYEINAHEICPSCKSGGLRYFGMGTQKVEELFKKEFPQMSVSRIDSDVMNRKNAHIEILEEFTKGNIDVLIGTQMIAKGLDVANVTLAGVISADSLFNIPDFRGNERGFQLLTQVSGRSGRGNFRGEVLFQTLTPGFAPINFAGDQDFLKFYEYELQSRNEYSYPPFSDIIRFIISSGQEIKAIKFLTDFAYRLKLVAQERGLTERLEVLGPSRCLIHKIKGQYRFQLLIKNTLGQGGHFLVSGFVKGLKIPADIKFLVDVDPSDML